MPWRGTLEKKPWQYKVTVAIPIRSTPRLPEYFLPLWNLQTIKPWIHLVDTGSSPDDIKWMKQFCLDNIRLTILDNAGCGHPSLPCAWAMDTAFAMCQTEYLLATHTDVFPTRRNLIEDLTLQCDEYTPAVGYQMSSRDWPGWENNLSHTCTMFYMPAMIKEKVTWNMRRTSIRQGISLNLYPPPNWTDTEVEYNRCLVESSLNVKFLGGEKNYVFSSDANIEHARSYGSATLYSPQHLAKMEHHMQGACARAKLRAFRWQREQENL